MTTSQSVVAQRTRLLVGLKFFAVLCLSLVGSTATLEAQTAVATLDGTVRDQSGAVLVGVTVTSIHRATNERKSTVTSETGSYRIPQLLPGFYDLTGEMPGFKKTTISNIELRVQQTARLDIVLEVGELSETTEVIGRAPLLQSEEASVGNVIDQHRVVELPLNGRGFLQLAFLVPGVSQAGPGSKTSTDRGTFNGDSAISVGGNRENANVFLLDGTINTDRNYNMFAIGPSLDAVQEFKVEVNSYAAEFGGQGGGQINIITKSGTNSFHGSGWGFFRDAKFDAKNFFDRGDEPIPPFDRQQFGAAVGGRLIRDKLFWFTNYEGFRQTKAQTSLAPTPNAQTRSGDFSNYRDDAGNLVLIYDPNTTVADPNTRSGYSRTPFPNNVIPVTRINPVSTKLLAFMDLPNQATTLSRGIGYFFNNFPRVESQDSMTNRMDYVISQSDRFFGRYSFSNERANIPSSFTGQAGDNHPLVQNVTLSESHTFGPTMFNDFRFGGMRFRNFKLPETAGKVDIHKLIGITGADDVSGDPDRWGVPAVSIADVGVGWGGGTVSNQRNNSFHFVDTFSIILGKHSLKLGEDILREQLNVRDSRSSPQGSMGSYGRYTNLPDNPGNTGSSLAQFLLGIVDYQQIQRGDPQLYMRRTQFALHINDDYKATPNLTLNLGLRWEYVQPWVEKYDHFSMNAWFGTYGGPPPLFEIAGGQPYAMGGTYKPLSLDPITGQPCTNCPKVSRGIIQPQKKNFMPRFGFAYRPGGSNRWVIRGGGGVFFDSQIANTIVDYARNGPYSYGPYINQKSQIFPADVTVDNFIVLGPGEAPGGGWGTTVNFPRAHIVNYNLAVQRQLGNSTSMTLQYIGSQSRKLSISVSGNAGISNPDACKLYPQECAANNGIIPVDQRYVFRNGGGDNRDEPIPFCCQVAMPFVNANYNAGAVTFERRFSEGLSVLSSYTFSKSIDNGHEIRGGGSADSEPTSWYRLGEWRGKSNFDQQHRFVTSWLWELPFGKGKRYLSAASRGADMVLGGWSVNGVYSANSGVPFTVYDFSVEFSFTPNVVGDPRLPRDQRSPDRWFDTTVFRTPDPNGDIGNFGRNVMRAPGTNNWDLGVFKRIPISERWGALQFRAEFFNAFNHPAFGFPQISFRSGNFGKITSARDPRNIQLGLRYAW